MGWVRILGPFYLSRYNRGRALRYRRDLCPAPVRSWQRRRGAKEPGTHAGPAGLVARSVFTEDLHAGAHYVYGSGSKSQTKAGAAGGSWPARTMAVARGTLRRIGS